MARRRCRVGDLAFIVSAPAVPSTVGRIVLVESHANMEGRDWIVLSQGEPFPFPAKYRDHTRAHCRDDNLCPIRPKGTARATTRSKREVDHA